MQHADFKVKPLVYVAIYVAPFLLVLLNFSISVIHKEKPFPILNGKKIVYDIMQTNIKLSAVGEQLLSDYVNMR